MQSLISSLQRLRERGDTLVEVMIAIAVISSMLGGAYVVTNKSLTASRDAQERGNALKLSEGQIERINAVLATNPNSIFGPGAVSPFCITNASTVVAASNAACQVDASGAATTNVPQYQLSITRSGNTFNLVTTWINVRGGNNRVDLSYKAYP